MSDRGSAEVDGDVGDSSDSRDSVQPVVRHRNRQRIITQDEAYITPANNVTDGASVSSLSPEPPDFFVDEELAGLARPSRWPRILLPNEPPENAGEDDGSFVFSVSPEPRRRQFNFSVDEELASLARPTRRTTMVLRNQLRENPREDDAADGSSIDSAESVGSTDQGGSSDDMQFIDRLIFEVRVARALNEMVQPQYLEPLEEQNALPPVEEDSNDNPDIQEVPDADSNPQEEPQPPIEAPAEPNIEDAASRPSTPRVSRRAQAPEPEVISLDSPSPPKKRKRLSTANTSLKKSPENKPPANLDDEDDGLTCPICLDSWEMSGDHRLVSLRCGHLFGEACIRRWLNESQRQSSVKVCPQCKTKASYRDIRHLYAKRIQMVDTEIKEQLEIERRRTQTLTTELATAKLAHTLTSEKLLALQRDYDRVKELLRAGGSRGAFSSDGACGSSQVGLNQLASHRLYMEKNFEITREPGCRVLLYSAKHSMLVASQKSAQNLFPGYGVRFIDPPTFRPLHFLHTSALLVRDIAFGESQYMLTVASREPKIKLFDIRSRLCSSMFTAHDKMLWSCALDRNEREHFLYGGDLRGGVYIYDTRFPETILSEFQAEENFSPVIHIVAVPPNKTFPSGGFLVCQLTALTFYEYEAASEAAVATRLNVEGPFLSMQYDSALDTLLISARSNPNAPQSRFILGKLAKMDNTPVLKVLATVFGSKATPIMTRPTQLGVEDNTLIVGYLQDTKQLMMHDVRREERVQTMPVNEVIYDICPVATQAGSYLAALTDNKCRVYKVNSSKR
ncbi:E3 ubiquitin-protein ligase RFWD3 [Drosophila bipectinata]|uniref:E3 ubiquitin-protein ligase RFWD3 n=1 Tax=Drosophila bipectinata TaxID=42026 RepID=UPI001C8930E9|nr:E3 ubiquitin-protein ligase RFWD3 [Drosophila bipectinata]